MMIHKLEKDVIFYKNQFENFTMKIFNQHRMERLSIDLDGLLFRIKYMVKHKKDLSILSMMKEEFITNALELRSIFGQIMYNFLIQIIGFEDQYTKDNIVDIMAQDVKIDNVNVKFKMILLSDDKEYLKYIDGAINDKEVFNLFPNEFFRFYVDSYNDGIAKAYPELFENHHQDKVGIGNDGDVFCHNFTFQTSENCNLQCSPAGTKILMADFSYKNIEEIQIGDVLLGVEEYITPHDKRTLIPTTVTKLFQHEEAYYKLNHVSLKDTLYFTADHPVLTGRGEWVSIKDLKASDSLLITTFDPSDYYDIDIEDDCYKKGYLMGATIGNDRIKYRRNRNPDRDIFRCGIENEEIASRIARYSVDLKLKWYDRITEYRVSTKFNTIEDTVFIGGHNEYMEWESLYKHCIIDMVYHNNPEFLLGFLAGIYDTKGSLDRGCIRIVNSDRKLLDIVENGLNLLKIQWVYDNVRNTKSIPQYTLKILGGVSSCLRFLKSSRPCVKEKGAINYIGKSLFRKIEGFSLEYENIPTTVYNFETTEHTYISNRLVVHNCTYCYQFNKTPMRMSFDIAKKFIDELLSDHYGYINQYNSPAIILEFIGGEPFLEIKLTRKIYEYFLDRTYELNHPWFKLHRLSICSNGLLYFDPEVQDFFKEYSSNISFNISIDGNKELHDTCRIQHNGEGSYDIDMVALNHYNKYHTPERNSKMTLAPSNMKYLFDSIVNFIKNGMMTINLNCIFEEGWDQETALLEYNELKRVADYILENNMEHLYISIFNERQEDQNLKSFDGSFCGGGGSMLSLRPNGQFYPCIRYMPTSVGDDVEDLCIGDVEAGMEGREEGSKVLEMMDNITRRSQVNDICYDCPIGNDCASCLALGHTVYGTPNKRTSFICIQMIAEALANSYYWNLLNIKRPDYNLGVRKNNVPKEWSLLVIDEDELKFLEMIELRSMMATLEYNKPSAI